jgi:galactokinase
MPLEVLARHSAELFAKCFGRAPQVLVAAPGRVNLIGEHTDYNDGFVLPMAIERHTVMAASSTRGREVVVHSETRGETATFNLSGPVKPGLPDWSNYIRGVVAGFQAAGVRVPAFEAFIESSLPYGGGLASSAALEVATATVLENLLGKQLDPLEKAHLCQKAEHDFAGVPCGIMDQVASILGKPDELLLLDCRTEKTTSVPLKDPAVTVLIVNTNTRHALAESEYAKRRSQCEEVARILEVPSLRDASPAALGRVRRRLTPVLYHRAKHVLSENERVLKAVEALRQGNWSEFGKLMYASHVSLRDDYQVSSVELDAVVETARELGEQEGIYGARMTGGGFGGCVVCLVRTDIAQIVLRKLSAGYEQRTRNLLTIFGTRPAAGARVLK